MGFIHLLDHDPYFRFFYNYTKIETNLFCPFKPPATIGGVLLPLAEDSDEEDWFNKFKLMTSVSFLADLLFSW